ncbi:hypothetical protein CBER1_02276 [Cercospora berteroae]|uniref:Uncharacterized protein n=1 Tax=Cercospora berteroae TaxID=357750 RepID=A0A2S6CB14_9PEZI|nr:hypothetical protein CBER1_02276 [Cercospora berteroae]
MQQLSEEEDQVVRGSEDEKDTDFRRRTLRSSTVNDEKGMTEDEHPEEAPLRQYAILLPQELIDMILEYLFDDDPHAQPCVQINSNFQTPLALRLCHWTREKYAAKYFTRTTFILSAHKFIHSSFFKYFHRPPYERTWCYIYQWCENENGCEVWISREQRPHPRHRRCLCKWTREWPDDIFHENEQWIGRLRTVKQFYRRRAKDHEVWRRSLEPTIFGTEPVAFTVCLLLLCVAVMSMTIREGWKGVISFEPTGSFRVRLQSELTDL